MMSIKYRHEDTNQLTFEHEHLFAHSFAPTCIAYMRLGRLYELSFIYGTAHMKNELKKKDGKKISPMYYRELFKSVEHVCLFLRY